MNSTEMAKRMTSALRGQYRAALATLEQSMISCDAETWIAAHPDWPVNRVVFHVLLFADVYLDWGEDVVREQEFHRTHTELFQDYEELEDRPQKNTYSKAGCSAYLEHCRSKVDRTMNEETEEVLFGDCGFPGRKLTRVELHIYNIRHIQHHAAQLGLRRQLRGGEPLRWVGKD